MNEAVAEAIKHERSRAEAREKALAVMEDNRTAVLADHDMLEEFERWGCDTLDAVCDALESAREALTQEREKARRVVEADGGIGPYTGELLALLSDEDLTDEKLRAASEMLLPQLHCQLVALQAALAAYKEPHA